MTINLSRIFQTLDDHEQIQVELEAEARGVSVDTVMRELMREGLEIAMAEGMDAVFQPRDSQWKSH